MVYMKYGKIERYIHETLEKEGAMLFSLIDPVDYKSEEDAVKTALAAEDAGSDVILLGGSTGAQGELLDDVARKIREKATIPIVLFPGNIATLTKHANAIYFMSLLNARNPYWITQAQMLSAPLIKKFGLEPLPVGYIVIQPGGTVGWVGDVNAIPREKPKLAAALALAGEYLGNRFIVTDVGANPRLQNGGPVPAEMIRAVREAISVPYIVAGGILTERELRVAYSSGADIVQIGTAFERTNDARRLATLFARVTKEEGRKKLKSKR